MMLARAYRDIGAFDQAVASPHITAARAHPSTGHIEALCTTPLRCWAFHQTIRPPQCKSLATTHPASWDAPSRGCDRVDDLLGHQVIAQ
jgi:hypothetical protein